MIGIQIGKKMWIVIAVIAAVIIVAIIAYLFYRKGKKQVSTQYAPNDLPYGSPGNGAGQSGGASNSEIKQIANDMHDDMSGLNLFTGHDMEPYQRALVLSDTDFVRLYNTFNGLYQADSGETMTQWIDNEKFYNNEITDTILSRCAKLNLI
jgi:hypothetical protein